MLKKQETLWILKAKDQARVEGEGSNESTHGTPSRGEQRLEVCCNYRYLKKFKNIDTITF